MKSKLIIGLIVSAVIVIGGAIFTVTSIGSTKQSITNTSVAPKAVSSTNNQEETTSNNNVAEGSNAETNHVSINNQVKNSPTTSETTNRGNNSSKTNSINLNNGDTQHAPGPGAHVNNMNDGSPMPTTLNSVGTQSSNSGKIEIIAPNVNSQFPISTVIVKNNTGKPISDSDLNDVMRNWILNWQFGRDMFGVATGENWAPQWLNAIPNSELINAFIEANGKEALSKNITADEINKGAMLFTQQANEKEPPFTIAQATKYIQEMLNKSNYDQTITKIVPHLNNNGGGLYYVYTKPFNSKGRNNPFWYVYTNTGQATGV